jgi:hypothetical protein
MLTTNVAEAAVTLPPASFVVTRVMDAFPCATDSALLIGGFSFAGEICAVKVGFVGAVDDGEVEEELQPTANRAAATANAERRVIVRLSFDQ